MTWSNPLLADGLQKVLIRIDAALSCVTHTDASHSGARSFRDRKFCPIL